MCSVLFCSFCTFMRMVCMRICYLKGVCGGAGGRVDVICLLFNASFDASG